MRLVEAREIDVVVTLQNLVYEGLPNKEVLYLDSKAEMLEDLYNGARIIGVFNSVDRLISYRYISFPKNASKNLGRDIALDLSELDKVVHLETTLVDPMYRGNRLQTLTLEKAIEMIEPMNMNHILCTVSPYNIFSLFNIMSAGLNIKALKKKYGLEYDDGMWRFILHKDLSMDASRCFDDTKHLKMDKIHEQKKLIENGYIGYNIIKESQLIEYSLTC